MRLDDMWDRSVINDDALALMRYLRSASIIALDGVSMGLVSPLDRPAEKLHYIMLQQPAGHTSASHLN